MSKPNRALIVMAQRPEPGVTKTRLVPRLSPEEAARFYECLLLDTLDLARSVPGVVPFVAVTPIGAGDYFRDVAPDFAQVLQSGATLGPRLDSVLSHCLEDGYDQVSAIGSDVPTLPLAHVVEAFDLLDDEAVDVVLGPSEDGGYHLIGWKHSYPRLVREVQMSTARVLHDTLALAESDGIRVALLPSWYDVDEPADLQRVRAELGADGPKARHTRRFFEQTP